MDERDKQKLNMFRAVQEFGVSRTTLFTSNSFAAEVLATLSGAIGRIEIKDVEQFSGGSTLQESAISKETVRELLQDNMESINRIGRSMASKIVGIAGRFRIPESKSDQALLTAAKTFLQNAEPLASEFIRRGMPTDFLDNLKSDIAQFEEIVKMRLQGKRQKVGANVGIKEDLKVGMEAVKEFDAYIKVVFRNDKALMAEWESTKHIVRRDRPSAKPAPAVEPVVEKN